MYHVYSHFILLFPCVSLFTSHDPPLELEDPTWGSLGCRDRQRSAAVSRALKLRDADAKIYAEAECKIMRI